jgi:hypothetical protein
VTGPAELAEPVRLVWRTEPCHFSMRGAGVRQPLVTTDPALLAWAQWNAAVRALPPRLRPLA